MFELKDNVLEQMEKSNEGWTMLVNLNENMVTTRILACSVCKNGCKGGCKTACSNSIKGKRGS